MKPTTLDPKDWHPLSFAELIGPAAEIGRIVDAKIARLKRSATSTGKFVFYGAPGVGKTELARFTALALAEDRLAIEETSGLLVTMDKVRGWMQALGMGGLFGDWQVKVVHEMDRIPRDAQDLLLDYLDRLPPKTGLIGTSNLQIDLLQERFQTRMQTWKVEGPSTEEIMAFLMAGWNIPRADAAQIAVGCGGNVRAALLDTESVLDVQLAA